jgi:acyl-CoA dehydrogenase
MDFNLTQEQLQIRDEIRKVCGDFPDAYWREIDRKKDYPDAFVRKLSELGWLAALIPEEFGGTGLGITEGGGGKTLALGADSHGHQHRDGENDDILHR